MQVRAPRVKAVLRDPLLAAALCGAARFRPTLEQGAGVGAGTVAGDEGLVLTLAADADGAELQAVGEVLQVLAGKGQGQG